jgi:hypothetical protein
MNDWVIWLLENQSGWVVIVGVLVFLALEFILDIVKDLLVDKIREKRGKNA